MDRCTCHHDTSILLLLTKITLKMAFKTKQTMISVPVMELQYRTTMVSFNILYV